MKHWIAAAMALTTALGFGVSAMADSAPARWPASVVSGTQPAAPSKREMIQRLKTLQERQATELASLETAIRKQLQDSMSLNVAKEETRYASAKTGMLAKKVDELNKRRTELNARREIIDRLIFAIDSKYTNQPLQVFLEQQFLDMASTDLADGRDSRMWKAYTYLSIAIREVPEPREDMFAVIEGFMNYSSILDPKTPAEFLAARNYTNGTQSVAARTMPKDEAGDEIASNAAAASGKNSANPVALELRMTMPKTAQQASAVPATQPSGAETLSGATRSAEEAPQPSAVN